LRICTRCNRELENEEFHEIVEPIQSLPDIVGWFKGHPVRKAEPNRGRRFYGCKVKLIATSPISGDVLLPNSPQRTIETDTKYVHASRFEGDLKPS
jgi:hypothetical protein